MKILWIALVWPEPGSSAAGFRTAQLIDVLKSAGHEVQVSSPCRMNTHRELLEAQGIRTAFYQPNDSGFDEYLTQLNPDVVFFDRFMAEEQFGWRVRERCPNAVRVLDTVDLHSLRRTRQRKTAGNKNPLHLSKEDLYSEDAVREISAIYRSDMSLIISEVEYQLLHEHYGVPKELLELCRFFYAEPSDDLPGFEARKNFVAIGNFNHDPNADSYRLLHQTLWKSIRAKLQDSGQERCELHIYGAYPTKEFMELDEPASGFRVKGWASGAVDTLANYRVNLAPLRFGAGLKGKISDGWAAGTPCAGTTIAAESMHGAISFGGVVEDDWERFTEQAAMLYSQRPMWEAAQQNGARIIRELFSEEINSSKFVRDIEALVSNRDERRLKNFTGAMLWHHQHRSTEFFSRWIEAKNKLAASSSVSNLL